MIFILKLLWRKPQQARNISKYYVHMVQIPSLGFRIRRVQMPSFFRTDPGRSSKLRLPGSLNSMRGSVGPACVVDVTKEVERDPNFLVSSDLLRAWEQKYERIPVASWLLLRTGWSRRTSAAEYINLKADGPHTPGWAAEASEFLAQERNLLGVGVETVGTDAGHAARMQPPFPNHYIMHGSGKFGSAGLCNLDQLPTTGAVVIAAPLKIVGGSGSPLRVMAITP
jgi:kynurenine formamidase